MLGRISCCRSKVRHPIYASSRVLTLFRYSEKQKGSLVEAINNSTEDELTSYSLGKSRARKLSKVKSEQGPFTTVEKIWDILDLTEGKLKRFCDNVLANEIASAAASKPRLSSIFIPSTNPQVLESISSVVGLHLGATATLSWAHVSRDFELHAWTHAALAPDTAARKLNPCALYDYVQRCFEQLPVADAYVLESSVTMPQQNYMQNHITRREVQATLVALLNSRPPAQHRVFFLRNRLAARLYGIQVGSERVSALPLIEDLVRGRGVGPEDSSVLTVHNAELLAAFRAQEAPFQETRSSALLLAMAFLKLAVREDPACLQALRMA